MLIVKKSSRATMPPWERVMWRLWCSECVWECCYVVMLLYSAGLYSCELINILFLIFAIVFLFSLSLLSSAGMTHHTQHHAAPRSITHAASRSITQHHAELNCHYLHYSHLHLTAHTTHTSPHHSHRSHHSLTSLRPLTTPLPSLKDYKEECEAKDQ